MKMAHQVLWDRVILALRPPTCATPEEVGRLVESCFGTREVTRLVHEYYQPHEFGGSAGTMSEDEAASLVAMIERLGPLPRANSSDAPEMRPAEPYPPLA
jgi:hypothetical protein